MSTLIIDKIERSGASGKGYIASEAFSPLLVSDSKKGLTLADTIHIENLEVENLVTRRSKRTHFNDTTVEVSSNTITLPPNFPGNLIYLESNGTFEANSFANLVPGTVYFFLVKEEEGTLTLNSSSNLILRDGASSFSIQQGGSFSVVAETSTRGVVTSPIPA